MSDHEPPPALEPLSPQERELLRERASDGASEKVPLQGRQLDHLTIRDLNWTGRSWRQLHAQDVTFVNCKLTGIDLAGAVLRDVHFQNCTLVECRFDKCRLERVCFAGGAVQGGRVREARMQGCRFEGVDSVGVMLDAAQIVDLHVARGKLSQVHFSECTIGKMEISAAAVSALQLTLCRGEQLHLESCDIADVALLGGHWARLELHGGTFGELALADVSARTVLLDGVTSSDRLNVNGCQIEQLSVVRCPELRDLYLFASKIRLLTMSHGTFSGWITRCQLGPGSRLEHATLDGFFWDETHSTELTLQDVTIRWILCARQARFEGLKLEDVRYGDDLRLVLEGARFEHSDRFGRSPP